MKGPEFVHETTIEIEPEEGDCYEVDARVELGHYVPFTAATHWQPEEGGCYEDVRVFVDGEEIDSKRPEFAVLCDEATIAAHQSREDYEMGRADYEYDRMKDEGRDR